MGNNLRYKIYDAVFKFTRSGAWNEIIIEGDKFKKTHPELNKEWFLALRDEIQKLKTPENSDDLIGELLQYGWGLEDSEDLKKCWAKYLLIDLINAGYAKNWRAERTDYDKYHAYATIELQRSRDDKFFNDCKMQTKIDGRIPSIYEFLSRFKEVSPELLELTKGLRTETEVQAEAIKLKEAELQAEIKIKIKKAEQEAEEAAKKIKQEAEEAAKKIKQEAEEAAKKIKATQNPTRLSIVGAAVAFFKATATEAKERKHRRALDVRLALALRDVKFIRTKEGWIDEKATFIDDDDDVKLALALRDVKFIRTKATFVDDKKRKHQGKPG